MIRMYHDQAGTQEVTEQNPDSFRKAVFAGDDLEDVAELYLKTDDPDLTYENVSITAKGDDDGASESGQIDVKYSLDGSSYSDTLELPDGDYGSPIKIYRRAVAPDVQAAFRRTDIEHKWTFDEYVK